MTDTTPPSPTNRVVAAKIRLSESGISRLRSGDRLPSLPLMQRIEKAYGWSVQAQSIARTNGNWTVEFERVVTRETRFSDA